jgi:hypothetical protein
VKISKQRRHDDDDYSKSEHTQLDALAAKWRAKQPPSLNGRRRLLPKKQSSPVYNQFCPSCNGRLELTTSTLGIMTFGFSSKWVELEPDYTIVDGELCHVSTMVRRSMPISRKVRVCLKCEHKLDKVIPEWENNTLLTRGHNSGLTRDGRITNRDFPRKVDPHGRRKLLP